MQMEYQGPVKIRIGIMHQKHLPLKQVLMKLSQHQYYAQQILFWMLKYNNSNWFRPEEWKDPIEAAHNAPRAT